MPRTFTITVLVAALAFAAGATADIAADYAAHLTADDPAAERHIQRPMVMHRDGTSTVTYVTADDRRITFSFDTAGAARLVKAGDKCINIAGTQTSVSRFERDNEPGHFAYVEGYCLFL